MDRDDVVHDLVDRLNELDIIDAPPDEYSIEWQDLPTVHPLPMALPDTCPGCGTDLDPSSVDQETVGDETYVYCTSCGESIPLDDTTRTNYKSPVVEDDDG